MHLWYLHCPLQNLCVLRVKNSVSIPVGPGLAKILTQRAQRFSRAHSRHWRQVDIASLIEKDLSNPTPEGEGDESRSMRLGIISARICPDPKFAARTTVNHQAASCRDVALHGWAVRMMFWGFGKR
jgi:hypothetical protein